MHTLLITLINLDSYRYCTIFLKKKEVSPLETGNSLIVCSWLDKYQANISSCEAGIRYKQKEDIYFHRFHTAAMLVVISCYSGHW